MNRSCISNFYPNFLKWLLITVFFMTFSSAFADTKEWRFEVLLDDSKIGQHTFLIKERENVQVLESKADFNVKILFFNAYSYKHRNVETWEGDCLSSITSSTDDNGKPYTINGKRQDDRFLVVTGSMRSTLPSCPMSFAYWNPEILDESQLLNSQTGEYLPVRIRELGEESLEITGKKVRADRYLIEAKDMRIELWYSKLGEWLALESTTESGRIIRYRLTSGASLAKQSKLRDGETS
jgi:hypothetical protein